MLLDMRLHCYSDWHAHGFFRVFIIYFFIRCFFLSISMGEGPLEFREMCWIWKRYSVFCLSHELIFCHGLNGKYMCMAVKQDWMLHELQNTCTISSIKTVIIQWDFFFFSRTLEKMFQLESNKWKKNIHNNNDNNTSYSTETEFKWVPKKKNIIVPQTIDGDDRPTWFACQTIGQIILLTIVKWRWKATLKNPITKWEKGRKKYAPITHWTKKNDAFFFFK